MYSQQPGMNADSDQSESMAEEEVDHMVEEMPKQVKPTMEEGMFN